jgi:cysteinyl-tRNA synthetase, unknown class
MGLLCHLNSNEPLCMTETKIAGRKPEATAPGRKAGARLLIRSLIGLTLLTTLVTTSAWLLYATSEPGNAFAADPDAAERRSLVAGVKSWSFETNASDPVAIRNGLGDLVVVDHNAVAHDRRNAERKAITAIQNKPNGSRRLVLGYVAIAEAEQRRPYWQSEWLATGIDKRPPWLGDENPQRRGNWRVNVADSGWHATLYGTVDSGIDRLLAAGFDGAYLDTGNILDTVNGDRSQAEWQLSELVSRIATYARLQHPRFIVMLDDADTLIGRTPVVSAIDIGAKHDLLYGHTAVGRANREADTSAAVKALTRVTAAKRPVFVIEHLADPALAETARRRIIELGFVPAISATAKDTIHTATPVDAQ